MRRRMPWQATVEEHMRNIPNLLTRSCCTAPCNGCDAASWATLSIVQQCAMEWKEGKEWKEDTVFAGLGTSKSSKKWHFQSEGTEHHTVWEQLRKWHKAYPTAASMGVQL